MVRSNVPGGSGSGFVVFARGGTRLIMTCEHVVHGLPLGSPVHMLFSPPSYDGQSTVATLLHVDEARDLALLRADGVQYPCNALGEKPTRPWMVVVLLAFFRMDDNATIIAMHPGTFAGKIV
ncbi:hypothetical protein BAE44_0000207 [Dichanthelium oligosanthes]|uniref:Trypsin-like peptidase domain-containing protein n=1 Tax=Dichanthelium oligosanthes TaxID=888268 RepID=A0A1E5WN20_9POAL|nr:hypothetical protein BAE44_0000207 [Dichanthelium oligosanthes]